MKELQCQRSQKLDSAGLMERYVELGRNNKLDLQEYRTSGCAIRTRQPIGGLLP